jgi:CheY-like chemotaxis protein
VDPGLVVRADRVRFMQILYNLLSNAIKFTPEGGSVWVESGSGGDATWLSVSDTGVGIAPEDQQTIFDEFRQVGATTKGVREGTGLGLAITQRLVHMHGGNVTAVSAGKDQGSTFTITLPACSRNAVPASGTDAASGAQRKSRCVLVVEDNDDGRAMTAALLAAHGHQVSEAATGRRALELFAQHDFDDVIIDIGLPDMSGLDVAREMRERSRRADVRLVAVTGYGQPEDKLRAFAAGFDSHATKPLTAEALFAIIEERREAAT